MQEECKINKYISILQVLTFVAVHFSNWVNWNRSFYESKLITKKDYDEVSSPCKKINWYLYKGINTSWDDLKEEKQTTESCLMKKKR